MLKYLHANFPPSVIKDYLISAHSGALFKHELEWPLKYGSLVLVAFGVVDWVAPLLMPLTTLEIEEVITNSS